MKNLDGDNGSGKSKSQPIKLQHKSQTTFRPLRPFRPQGAILRGSGDSMVLLVLRRDIIVGAALEPIAFQIRFIVHN